MVECSIRITGLPVRRLLLAHAVATLLGLLIPSAPAQEYSIQAIRYASAPNVPVAELVMGAPKGDKIDGAMIVWLIRGGGRTVLFDNGFHREKWFKELPMTEYLRPDEGVKLAGVKPEEVTDIIIRIRILHR
jgi:hypothetical protein